MTMPQVNLEPVVIEDLVHFGEDRGYERGLERGLVKEARSALRRVLAFRKLALSAEEEARIDACSDLDTLHRWQDQAFLAASAGKALR